MMLKKESAGGFDTTTADTNPDTSTVAEKQFNTLRAEFAMRGHCLQRTSRDDGPVTYFAERWGMVRYLPTLDDARRFLAQIGGAV